MLQHLPNGRLVHALQLLLCPFGVPCGAEGANPAWLRLNSDELSWRIGVRFAEGHWQALHQVSNYTIDKLTDGHLVFSSVFIIDLNYFMLISPSLSSSKKAIS